MKKFGILAILASLSFLMGRSGFTDTEHFAKSVLSVIRHGFDTYVLEGPESAVTAWTQGGPITAEDVASSAKAFKEVEKFYGSYVGYRILRMNTLSSNSKLVYFQMNYEKGPLFGRFLCYRPSKASAWFVTERLLLNTDPQKVLST